MRLTTNIQPLPTVHMAFNALHHNISFVLKEIAIRDEPILLFLSCVFFQQFLFPKYDAQYFAQRIATVLNSDIMHINMYLN